MSRRITYRARHVPRCGDAAADALDLHANDLPIALNLHACTKRRRDAGVEAVPIGQFANTSFAHPGAERAADVRQLDLVVAVHEIIGEGRYSLVFDLLRLSAAALVVGVNWTAATTLRSYSAPSALRTRTGKPRFSK